MRPVIAAIALASSLAACAPHFELNLPSWQPYFQQVRAGEHPSECDDAARLAPGRMAVVLTEQGQGHMVAIDALGYVTDNRVKGGAFWWQLPYRWIAEER